MKRILFSISATVLGVGALLSYKTHGQVTTAGSVLPSAALPASSSGVSTPASPSTSAAAPPNPRVSSSAPPASVAPSTPADATFTGTAETTRYGIVQVKITVAGKKITNAAFAQLTAFDDRSQEINSAAAPILLQETLSAQSANIDSVSGASYTSQGYQQSLQNALDQAGI